MTSATPELVVPATSCLIALAGIGRLDVLRTLHATTAVPTAARRELGSDLPGWIVIEELAAVVRPLVGALTSMLGAGESEAIALAADRPGALVVLDDLRARRVARDMRLRLTGTVGVLLRAKREGVVDSVGDALARAEAGGFRVWSALRDEALRLAGESDASG